MTAATDEAFSHLAERFCAWAKSPPLQDAEDARKALRLLAELYGAAVSLPEVDAGISDSSTDAPAPVPESVNKRLGLLPFENYWDFSLPLATPTSDLKTARLSHELSVVYRHLKHGLSLVACGGAGAYWRASFWREWGASALSALKALHFYVAYRLQ